MTEIVQATTICNVQAAKGLAGDASLVDEGKLKDSDNETRVKNDDPQQCNQIARLQRYISQLVQAKTLCDNRLRELKLANKQIKQEWANGNSVHSVSNGSVDDASCTSPLMGPHVMSLSFSAIMNSAFSRRYFHSYLESCYKGRPNQRKDTWEASVTAKIATPPYQV